MDIAEAFADGTGLGLQDLHAKLWTELKSGIWVVIAGHSFATDVDTTLPSGGDGNDIGKEVDVILKGRTEQGVDLQVGGGYFIGGDLVEALAGSDDALWGFVQATADF
jgi:hypothetical protein